MNSTIIPPLAGSSRIPLTYLIPVANKPVGVSTTFPITIRVSYPGIFEATKTASLVVSNCPPIKKADVPSVSMDEDSYNGTMNLFNYFEDLNNNTLQFNKVGAPQITLTNLGNGLINLTPARNFNGTVSLNFTVYDGVNTTQSNPVIVTVTGQNDAPVINAINDQPAQQGVEFTYQVIASDADNDTLTYGLVINDTALPASINSTSGRINNWTPTNAQAGKVYLFNTQSQMVY